MPLQIAPVPYRGDQYLAQGISSAGQNIAEGIEGMTKRLRQTKAMRTMAVDGMGMDPDKVDNMTPEQIQGIMQGMAVKNAQAEAQARRQMEQAHADYFHRFNQKAAAEDRFSSAVNDYMQPPVPNTGNPLQQPPSGDIGRDMMNAPDPTGVMQQMTQPRTLDPQTLMRLEAQAGTLDPDKAMQYMKQLNEGPGADNPMVYDNTSVPNATVIRRKKGNEFQVLRNNDGTAPDAPPGYQMVGDGKGGWKAVKLNTGDLSAGDRTKYQAQYEKNIDSLIQSYSFAKGDPEMETLIKGRIAAHQKAIEDLQTPAAPAKPAAGAKALGGYKIGTKYAGLTYLGGDPKDQASWQK